MRGALKTMALVAAGLGSGTLLLIALIYVAGNTDSGRAMIVRLTEQLTAGHVKLSGLTGSFPQQLTLQRLELSDERGVWLTAEGVTLNWSPLALVLRRLQVDALTVAKILMARAPEGSTKTSDNSVPIPRIDVAHMSVDSLELGPQLAGARTSLVLDGSAHLRSIQDMILDATAHRLDGDGNYELHLRFDTRRMDAALKLHEPANGPLENLLQIPGLGELTAQLNLSGPRAAEHFDMSLVAGELRGQAHGGLNLTDGSAELSFGFVSAAMSPRPGVAWERATLEGHWHGSVKTPQAHGHLEMAKLRIAGGVQLATLSADIEADGGRATLRALLAGLILPGPEPRLLEDSPLKIDASIRLDQPTRPVDLTVDQRLFSIRAQAETAGILEGKQNATVNLRLLKLGAFAALAGQDVRGTALVKAQVRGDGKATHVTLDATAALDVGTQIWSAAVGERAALLLSGTLTDKGIDFDNVRFTGRAVSLLASGKASREAAGSAGQTSSKLRFRWAFDVADLRTLSTALAGTLNATGTLEGSTAALAAAAHVSSTLSVRGSPSGTLSADIDLRGLPSAPSGTLLARGSLDQAPLYIDIAAQRSPGGLLRTLIRRAEWKSAHLDGDLTVAAAAAQARGELHLQMDQLGDLRRLLGIDLGGSLSGTAIMRPEPKGTHAHIELDVKSLAAGHLVGNAQLTGDGDIDEMGLKLEVQVPNLNGTAARASTAGSLNLDAHEFRVASIAANYRGQILRLLTPAKVSFADGISVDSLKLGVRQAQLQLQGKISPVLDARISLRQLQPDLVNVFLPGLLESGDIEAHAEIQGSLAEPAGQIRLNAKGVRLADDAALGLPALALQAHAQLRGNTADIDAQATAGEALKLTAMGQVPLGVDGALNLKISGNLDVGMINPLLEARGQRAAGELAIDARIAGSVEQPDIGGTVKLLKGSIRDYGRGVSITDIAAEVVGSQGTLQVKSFKAAAAPGTVSMAGSFGVLQKGWPIDLRIQAENAQPIVSKLVTANLNADLHVSGTVRERIDIAGTVHLNRTLIGIPSSLPPNVAVLDIRRRGKAAAAVAEKELVIGLDVTVQAPQEVLVQGRGLDAEMGGELHLSGTTETPLVSGGFDLLRGSFSLASSKLNFNTGSRVGFNGAGLKNKIDPTLDFTAQTTVADATTTLRITGLADAPQFEFTSNPLLPQDEIMARLLFGVNAAQLSALQLAQIGAALANLSGVGGDSGLNPLVKLQKSLRLDRLTVGAGASATAAGTENSGASIEAGRYISKRVYVEAKQTTTGTSQLGAVVDLTKHLKLQTKLGNGTAVQGTTPENDPGTSVGLSYQFEY